MDKNKALEDLNFIKNIIDQSKQSIIFGRSFINWGILITFSLIATYIMIQLKAYSYIKWWWTTAISCGWIYEAIYWKKCLKRENPRTFIDKIIGKVWIAFGISASIIGFSGMFLESFGNHISALVSLLLAIAVFATGELIRKTYWRFFACGWWCVALIMLIWPGIHNLLIMASSMIAFQILPGIMIQKNIEVGTGD